MAAVYTPITLEEMETFLKRAFRALKPRKSVERGEYVIDLFLDPYIGVRIWTSISKSGTSSADVGQDAIRVQYFHFGRGKPLTAGKAPIVKRTQNWKDSLQDRVEDVVELYSEQDSIRDEDVLKLDTALKLEDLKPSEKEAFEGMRERLEKGEFMSLTDKQRGWLESRLTSV